ncbi:uncharacterized protein CC84DRAFT_1161230 [Paraphaeosphaeria sporulosa]|uniref:Glycosyltransferase 2 n=1 Tax=Paraphaeosphaeria sporulosa TaxID=1460663 RepID=A0A177CSS2_9PLEO|nr:uncharacterized protein CC84DRAFT_1161230 [Paraphaeosphaeria sporulosa]OAG10251.1 hypothetical protein CC84DRAFT_1161230 [Paraphaeosphaeria sporulosa]
MLRSILPGDEELGKKDDDHKPGAARMPKWTPRSTPLRWRRRRILLAVVGLCMVYLLVKNVPSMGGWTDQITTAEYASAPPGRFNYAHEQATNEEPTGPPPGYRAPRVGEPAPHTFDGQFKFYRLAASLHGASHTYGYRAVNRNIVFPISSLHSASTMLPMICEMARWSRNYVHAAFMGREDVDVARILEINGIDQIKCPAIWHDARPDWTEYSSDDRAELSVMAAMTHINTFLHPQAAIVDDALSEDGFFTRGVRAKTEALHMPLIEIPKDKLDSTMWITRLDAGSLRSWNLPTVDILIQVPPDSASVARLLKSIRSADYSGLNLPHITLELPADLDETVEQFLDEFSWPPSGHQSHITTRRKIGNQRATQEESAVRFLELFYPSSKNSHLLLLSPQAELSPQYYQYLIFTLLEYRYSTYAEDDAAGVMGVTLELPSVLLNGETKLNPPKPPEMHSPRYSELFADTKSVPYLWQAPNSHATLYFGDKWAELHSFLSNRVAKQSKAPQRKKLVSETLPAWMEYTLEFMRARGYALFYPGATSEEALVTIHNELYHMPEEFASPKARHGDDGTALPIQTNEPFLRGDIAAPTPKLSENKVVSHSRPLHLILPFEGDLPEIPHLPYLLHRGDLIPHSNVSSIAETYAAEYRKVIGGCTIPTGKHRKIAAGSARDLFCFGDEEDDDWENDIEVFDADTDDDYRDIRDSALTNNEIVAIMTTTGSSVSATPEPTATSSL